MQRRSSAHTARQTTWSLRAPATRRGSPAGGCAALLRVPREPLLELYATVTPSTLRSGVTPPKLYCGAAAMTCLEVGVKAIKGVMMFKTSSWYVCGTGALPLPVWHWQCATVCGVTFFLCYFSQTHYVHDGISQEPAHHYVRARPAASLRAGRTPVVIRRSSIEKTADAGTQRVTKANF